MCDDISKDKSEDRLHIDEKQFELNEKDVALVIRKDGISEFYLPDYGDEAMPSHAVLLSGIYLIIEGRDKYPELLNELSELVKKSYTIFQENMTTSE